MDSTKKILYFDMDDVLVDFSSGVACLSEETKKEYEDRLDEVPGIFSLMKPLDGAIEAVKLLSQHYDVYVLSTAPWKNISAWSDKAAWVQKYFGDDKESPFYKRLAVTHNKNLIKGDFLIDDRIKNGAGEFEGELILFGSEKFPSWKSVTDYLIAKAIGTSGLKDEDKNIEAKGVADIVFCLDCTCSMEDCIKQILHNVQPFVNVLNARFKMTTDWRVRVMGYRDFNLTDHEKIINDFPFVNDANSLRKQLAQLEAVGGGDNPESTMDALWYALKETDWRTGNCHKVIVLFTDDETLPVHKDTIAKFGIAGAPEYLLQQLAENKIKLFMFAKNSKIYDKFESLPNSYIKLYYDPQTEFDENVNFKELMTEIAKTVSSEAIEINQ